ncbi:hypothetical protein ACFQ9X_56370 [Catenulispora yoronensis]
MSGPKRSSRSRAAGAVVAERRAKAVRMKVSGARLEDIAAALGYNSVNHVSVDIKRALAANLREQSAATEEYIAIEMLRLDELLFAVWEEAMAGSRGTWNSGCGSSRPGAVCSRPSRLWL